MTGRHSFADLVGPAAIQHRTLPPDAAATDAAPAVYTVEEAAHILRIGRSLPYTLARRYLDTAGRDGLPVLRVGSCLRVPRWALLEFIQTATTVSLPRPFDRTA
jgi:Helix-turn-helix domain